MPQIRDKKSDGDFRAEIHTRVRPDFDKYITITFNNHACGAVAKYIQSDEECIYVDKYLRLFLNAKNNDIVQIEGSNPVLAKSVVLKPLEPTFFDEEGLAEIRSILRGKPVCSGFTFPWYRYIPGAKKEILISETNPGGIVIVQDNTNISFDREIISDNSRKPTGPTWGDIGGLDREIADIRRRIEYPLRNAKAFGHFGADAPRGILLTGPPGTGKTLIARALASEAGAHIEIIQGPQILTPFQGQSEQTLFETFEKARKQAPSIILIDEIDSLAQKRESLRSEANNRLVATLLVLMDGLKSMDGVIVIGTTNRPEELDEALRRPGRFEREIMIGIPDKTGRKQILDIHTKRMPLAPDVQKDALAEITFGFTGADLASLCREAGYCAIFRYFTEAELQNGTISPDPNKLIIYQDFLQAMKSVQPTAMRSGMVEDVRDIKLEDVGGLDEIKEMLMENANSIFSPSNLLETVGFQPAKSVLLYGASGIGKTTLARAIANACGVHLITLRGPEIHRKWFGESEELVRKVFAKARQVAPCIVLLDEVDALVPARGNNMIDAREGITSQTITELETIGISDQIFVIATTNQPENIDPALRRPGRLDVEILVNPPNKAERRKIFEIQLKKVKHEGVDFDELAGITKNFSGADIKECCRRAVFQVLKQLKTNPEKASISMASLKEAIEKVSRTDRFKRLGPMGFNTSHDNPDEE